MIEIGNKTLKLFAERWGIVFTFKDLKELMNALNADNADNPEISGFFCNNSFKGNKRCENKRNCKNECCELFWK